MPTSIPPFSNVPGPLDPVQSAWAQQLTQYAVDHVNDATDAHDASAISFIPGGTLTATNVQAALLEAAAESSGGTGPAGPGVVAGGDTGQVLAKATATDYDTEWVDPPTGGGSGTPGGSLGQVQFNNAGAFGGAGNVSIDTDGHLLLLGENAPLTTPAANSVKFGSMTIGDEALPVYHLSKGRPAIIPPGGWTHTSVIPGLPVAGSSMQGTIRTDIVGAVVMPPNFTTTNLYSRSRGAEVLVTTPASNAFARLQSSDPVMVLGDSGGAGGSVLSVRWGPATGVVATNRAFCGIHLNPGSGGDIQPSTMTNMLGMGWDSADANVQMMHNDTDAGATGATKVNLGATFPVPTADRTAMYELLLYQPHASAKVCWMVTNLVSGARATGTITTKMTAALTMMWLRISTSVGGTSSAVGLALFGVDAWICL